MKIKLHPEKTIAANRLNVPGINVNYFRDADANRKGRPLHEALKDMGVKHLRYPGGSKSDRHFFAKPPYERCEPTAFAGYEKTMSEAVPMDFDMFIDIARKAGAEPHVNVSFHTLEYTGYPLETYLEHAAAWVKYANITKGYGVKYWEVGNENWLTWIPDCRKGTPEEVGYAVSEFSRAMKAVDPSIKICASGFAAAENWWDSFLPLAMPYIDVLTTSQYLSDNLGSYDYYMNHDNISLMPQVKFAEEAIDKYGKERKEELEIVVSEFNSLDWGKIEPWNPSNNLGHSIVTFDMIGQILINPRVSYGMLWNTRYMNQKKQHENMFFALDERNELLPSGMSLKLWGRYLRDIFVEAEDEGKLIVYACKDEKGMTVFVINKMLNEENREIDINGAAPGISASYCYTGSLPDDQYPVFGVCDSSPIMTFPPFSITILEFTGSGVNII